MHGIAVDSLVSEGVPDGHGSPVSSDPRRKARIARAGDAVAPLVAGTSEVARLAVLQDECRVDEDPLAAELEKKHRAFESS